MPKETKLLKSLGVGLSLESLLFGFAYINAANESTREISSFFSTVFGVGALTSFYAGVDSTQLVLKKISKFSEKLLEKSQPIVSGYLTGLSLTHQDKFEDFLSTQISYLNNIIFSENLGNVNEAIHNIFNVPFLSEYLTLGLGLGIGISELSSSVVGNQIEKDNLNINLPEKIGYFLMGCGIGYFM